MSQRRRLEDSLRWRAIGRLEAGQSQTEVALWLGVSRNVVSYLWKQFQQNGSIERRPVNGRPRATTVREDRFITITAKRNREFTARRLSNELASSSGTRISRFTIYRRLHAAGLYARRPMVCVPLTNSHRRERLNWARDHHTWSQNQWANVLFSDESRFSLETDSRRIFIWRESGTRYHPTNIRERDRYGGGGLMVWAGIMLDGRTPLHIFDGGTLTAQRYRDEILEPYVRLFRGAIGPEFIFMDDNARPHRAQLVNEFIEGEDIQRMEWPARSPDLNPIEHAWDALGRAIGSRQIPPRTLTELKLALQEEWNLLSQELFRNLLNSMKHRCEACIAVKGGHTPY
jgi:transposase